MKDAIGNKITEGSLVRITLANGLSLRGRVKSIRDGGVSLVGAVRSKGEMLEQTPGLAVVNCEFELESDPRTGINSSMERLHDPSGEDLKAETRQ